MLKRKRSLIMGALQAIIDAHGKDLLADDGGDDSAPASGASTPVPAPTKAASSVPDASSKSTGSDGKATFNTAIVKADAEYACTADDLFNFLTDEVGRRDRLLSRLSTDGDYVQTKIPMWSRNPAKMKPEVGAEMSLFGGNIAGKVTAVSRPDSITCDWRAPTWPEGTDARLKGRAMLIDGVQATTGPWR